MWYLGAWILLLLTADIDSSFSEAQAASYRTGHAEAAELLWQWHSVMLTIEVWRARTAQAGRRDGGRAAAARAAGRGSGLA